MNFEDAVYADLREIGCCNRCCLRFMGDKSANFEDPEQYIQDLLTVVSNEDIAPKRNRSNPCIVCLGVLENRFLDELLQHSCWTEIEEYESVDYRLNLSTPPNISIRNKAVDLYLKQKHPEFYTLHGLNESVVPIHIVFKLAFKTKLDRHCKRSYNVHSDLQLWTEIHHEDNEKEVKVMWNLDPSLYKSRDKNRRRYGDKMFGKNAVIGTLSTVDDKTFIRHCSIPPEIPTNPVQIISVLFESLPFYFVGRYCKYSRKLYQTPWTAESGENDYSNSVQDIICNGLQKVFGFAKEKMTFSSSGREDVDVRCLGSGRPFYVKIENSRKKYPEHLFRKLEETVNESPDVAIFDMQQSDRSAVSKVKQGEELKKKSYLALCLIRDKSKNVEEIIEKINELGRGAINVNQGSPIRVIHRRVVSIRPKKIYQMSANRIPGHEDLFELYLQVQAGTYIKEFVHGDFGRTSPSISDLVQANVDIFRLDVIGIDLDWPPHINSTTHPLMLLKGKEVKEETLSVKDEALSLKEETMPLNEETLSLKEESFE